MILNMLHHGPVPITCRMPHHSLSQPLSNHAFWNRVGKEGSDHARWERETWPYLKEITEKHPEAGIHFLGILIIDKDR